MLLHRIALCNRVVSSAVASLHAVIIVTSPGRRWLPPRQLPRCRIPSSAHGLRHAAGFFLAYFEHRRRISIGYLHGHS
jgi:hypothetical protein